MPTTAELLLHSERVSRHVSGVEQALSELNEGLEVLSDNQTERVERLVDDVSRLDRIYTAATKLSRYISYVFIFWKLAGNLLTNIPVIMSPTEVGGIDLISIDLNIATELIKEAEVIVQVMNQIFSYTAVGETLEDVTEIHEWKTILITQCNI